MGKRKKSRANKRRYKHGETFNLRWFVHPVVSRKRLSTGPHFVSVSCAWLTIQGLRKIVPWRLMPLLAFIQATTFAHCRSISTVRQIYCVMDGRGKLQFVLSLKDRLCLTFPASACTLEPCFRGSFPVSEKLPLALAIAILTRIHCLLFSLCSLIYLTIRWLIGKVSGNFNMEIREYFIYWLV